MTTKDALLTDWELWAAASYYVAEHGEDAGIVVATRCDELFDAQDFDGVRNYQAILDRVSQLLDVSKGMAN